MRPDPGQIVADFQDRRVALRGLPDDALYSEGVFAVGLLLGGGWPGAAAAVANFMDDRFTSKATPWGPP